MICAASSPFSPVSDSAKPFAHSHIRTFLHFYIRLLDSSGVCLVVISLPVALPEHQHSQHHLLIIALRLIVVVGVVVCNRSGEDGAAPPRSCASHQPEKEGWTPRQRPPAKRSA